MQFEILNPKWNDMTQEDIFSCGVGLYGAMIFYANFSAFQKHWPMEIKVNGVVYKFAGQEALRPEESGVFHGRAKYISTII